ncbi:mannose-1-phosphate guanylyltransferase [soil metagenome]
MQTENQTDQHFWSVIPAGGAGTRLWPLSRAAKPKFLLPLLGERSLLQQTVDRVVPFSSPNRTIIVAGADHADEIAVQVPELPAENILIEPSPKGTAPAIGLAALLIHERDPEAIMASFAADHAVQNLKAFGSALRSAQLSASDGWLTTIGLTPTRPETGYGYIQRTDTIISTSTPTPVYVASRFTEKPDLDLAETFIASGRYLWNASMFFWRVDRFIEEMATHQRRLFDSLSAIANAWHSSDQNDVLQSNWTSIQSMTVDQGIMEKTASFAVVPAEMGWSDVGDWHGLGELLEKDDDGNSIRADCILEDVTNSVVYSTTDRLVAMIGIDGLVVIDTPDALLVIPRDRAQGVRSIVDQLRKNNDERN